MTKSPLVIRSRHACLCKNSQIVLEGDTKPLLSAHGVYSTHGGEFLFYARAVCQDCGLIYDPDNPRFAGDFNEIVHRLSD
jgi:hypothetical protein